MVTGIDSFKEWFKGRKAMLKNYKISASFKKT